MSLPLPRIDTSLVLCTDFSDDLAWEALKVAINAEVEHDATVQPLIDAGTAAAGDAKVCRVFFALAACLALVWASR